MKIKIKKGRKKSADLWQDLNHHFHQPSSLKIGELVFFSALHFTVNIHFFHFFIPLPFHIFPFDPISKEQLNMKKRLNPESLFTEQQKSTAWTLVFPEWRPAWST